MDLDYVESLAELLRNSTVTELTVRRGDRSVTLRRQGDGTVGRGPVAAPAAEAAPAVGEAPASATLLPVAVVADTALVPVQANGHDAREPRYEIIRAHRVGIFHRGLVEGGEALVGIGDPVAPRQQLGSIESMRLFDEVDNTVCGRVVGVFVEPGEAVEYGQPLFHIELGEISEDASEGETL